MIGNTGVVVVELFDEPGELGGVAAFARVEGPAELGGAIDGGGAVRAASPEEDAGEGCGEQAGEAGRSGVRGGVSGRSGCLSGLGGYHCRDLLRTTPRPA